MYCAEWVTSSPGFPVFSAAAKKLENLGMRLLTALCACDDVTEWVLCVSENNVVWTLYHSNYMCISTSAWLYKSSQQMVICKWSGWSAADSQNSYCYSHDTVGFLLFPWHCWICPCGWLLTLCLQYRLSQNIDSHWSHSYRRERGTCTCTCRHFYSSHWWCCLSGLYSVYGVYPRIFPSKLPIYDDPMVHVCIRVINANGFSV